ncbi:MAG TPA: substrate-binding domain-containing protein [Solirubrobacteraceae bacterium]|nr:substrate-binding domain-containing protein [Solirubrobacteraceae bacterium]
MEELRGGSRSRLRLRNRVRGLAALGLVAGVGIGLGVFDTAASSARSAHVAASASGSFGPTLKNGTYGECYNPTKALVGRILYGVASLPSNAAQKNVVLAALCRAQKNYNVNSNLAYTCWKNDGCSTGTNGKLTVGEADGFGGNSAREMFKMEFILQALTYPQIGKILYTDANLNTEKAISDVRSMVAQGAKVILSYPDAGAAMLPSYQAAEQQGDNVALWSNANIGKAGTQYMTVTGTNICTLGNQYAAEMNKDLPKGGQIAFLGGTPGNTQSPAWQACEKKALNKNIKVVATANTSWTRQGALQATSAIISKYPKLNGISYDYGDATVGVIRAFQAAHRSLANFVITDYSNENSLLCLYKQLKTPSFKVYTYVNLESQARISLTAGMMKLVGATIPPEINFQPSLRQVTLNSCQSSIPIDGLSTALVAPALQKRMFG